MFMPMTLTVAVGTTVTWKFDDSTDHTVAADDKSFTSPPLGKGKTYTHTFNSAGTVKYHCSIHPFMTGTITVQKPRDDRTASARSRTRPARGQDRAHRRSAVKYSSEVQQPARLLPAMDAKRPQPLAGNPVRPTTRNFGTKRPE
jgi:hypothetical protein